MYQQVTHTDARAHTHTQTQRKIKTSFTVAKTNMHLNMHPYTGLISPNNYAGWITGKIVQAYFTTWNMFGETVCRAETDLCCLLHSSPLMQPAFFVVVF